jgi:hypothetical protein
MKKTDLHIGSSSGKFTPHRRAPLGPEKRDEDLYK